MSTNRNSVQGLFRVLVISSSLPARGVMRISAQLLEHQRLKVLLNTYKHRTRLAPQGCVQNESGTSYF